jgi:hypothetical protein
MSWPPHAHRGGPFREGVTPQVGLVVAAAIIFEVEIALVCQVFRRGSRFKSCPRHDLERWLACFVLELGFGMGQQMGSWGVMARTPHR